MIKTTWEFGNLYLGNKMTGVPFFNSPWFDGTTMALRSTPGVASVFNPAEWDRLRGFNPMECPNGTHEEAIAAGFDAREALGSDWTWIAQNSNGLIIGPDWASSPGTISEIACHQALRLPVWEVDPFFRGIHRGTDLFDPAWQFPQLGVYLL